MTGWLQFLEAHGARTKAGLPPPRVSDFGSPEREYNAARNGAIVTPLLDWTALVVGGVDAPAFLQGQFTNDVADLQPGGVQYNGYCSPKGRLLATFALARPTLTDYLIVAPADVAPAFEKRLRMFVLRAKVDIVSCADTHVCLGIAGTAGPALLLPPAATVQDDGISLLALPEPPGLRRQIAVCEMPNAQTYWNAMAGSATAAGTTVWDWLGIAAGVPVVTSAVQDRFVPQMLNWEIVGGVSFQKGCYPGQEIVARMQYLGKLKERLYRGHIAGNEPVAAGNPLYGDRFGDQACGTIVNAAPAPAGGWDVLAVMQTASAGQDRIRLAPSPDGRTLALLPLPYPVPETREKRA